MYAIIKHDGRQYKVSEGEELEVDLVGKPAGEQLTLGTVLAVSDDSGLRFAPQLSGATVTAEVVGVTQGPKLVVQKFRRRKTFRKRTGHRQMYSRVKITKISV